MRGAVGLIVAIAISQVVTSVYAAGEPRIRAQNKASAASQAEKRRVLLPIIRAATDCVARELLEHPRLIEVVEEDRWMLLIPDALLPCHDALQQLALEHDRLHGPGSGKKFLNGAYLKDLPRALATRLKPEADRLISEAGKEVSRRVAEAGRLEAERQAAVARLESARQQRTESLERARDLSRNRLYRCAEDALDEQFRSSEAVEVLAASAMTVCEDEVEQAVDAALAAFRSRSDEAQHASDGFNLRDEIKKVVQQNVITVAARARMAAAGGSRTFLAARAAAAKRAQQGLAASAMRELTECLDAASSMAEGRPAERDRTIEAMLELCRPELEGLARASFLEDPSSPLDGFRERAVLAAREEAGAIYSGMLSTRPDPQ
jgi:hypothetical protein